MIRRLPMLALLLAALVAIAASPIAARAADTFDLDQSHFSIVFSVSHMNMSYTYGMFKRAEGTIVIDRQNPAANQFDLTIKADSIDTANPQRDTHLKGPDFFDVATYPDITFKSTTVVQDTSAGPKNIVYQVTGDLTMHGVSRPITLAIQFLGEGQGPDGKPHAGFLTQTEIKRSEFGMTKFVENNMVGDAIGITVSFEGIKR